MRLKIFILGSLSLIAFGCSHKTKKNVETPATPVLQQTSVVTLPPVPHGPEKKEEEKKEVEKKEAAPKTDETVCKKDKEKRTLKITSVQPKGCELWYSNYSTVKPVASSEIATTHCQTVHDNIKGKLEAADYKCTQASVTEVMPTATPAATPAVSPSPSATSAVKK